MNVIAPAGALTPVARVTVNVLLLKTAALASAEGAVKVQTGVAGHTKLFNCTTILPATGMD